MLNLVIPHCDILRTDYMVGSFKKKHLLRHYVSQKPITKQAQDSAAEKEKECF